MRNQLTNSFFKTIKENTHDGLDKMKSLWKMSQVAKQSNLDDLVIQLEAVLKVEKKEFSLLSYAIHCDNRPAFDFLFKNEARLNLDLGNPCPLILAIEKKDDDIFQTLIKAGADVDNSNQTSSPLQCAVEQNYELAILLLIQNGAQVNQGEPTPLCCAIQGRNKPFIRFLLSQNADPNAGEATPLWLAITQNDYELVQLLIDYGADVNKTSIRTSQKKVTVVTSEAWRSNKHHYPECTHKELHTVKQSVSPIYQAAEQNSQELIKLLLVNDANASIRASKCTIDSPLRFYTPKKYNTKSVAELLKKNVGFQFDSHRQGKTLKEKCALYNDRGLMALCLKRICLAKEAYSKQETTSVMRYLCDAYDIHRKFYADYLANRIRSINLS